QGQRGVEVEPFRIHAPEGMPGMVRSQSNYCSGSSVKGFELRDAGAPVPPTRDALREAAGRSGDESPECELAQRDSYACMPDRQGSNRWEPPRPRDRIR